MEIEADDDVNLFIDEQQADADVNLYIGEQQFEQQEVQNEETKIENYVDLMKQLNIHRARVRRSNIIYFNGIACGNISCEDIKNAFGENIVIYVGLLKAVIHENDPSEHHTIIHGGILHLRAIKKSVSQVCNCLETITNGNSIFSASVVNGFVAAPLKNWLKKLHNVRTMGDFTEIGVLRTYGRRSIPRSRPRPRPHAPQRAPQRARRFIRFVNQN